MIRRINLVNLFSQAIRLHEKCRGVPSAMSYTRQIKYFKNSEKEKPVNEQNENDFGDTFGNIESFDQMFHRIKEDPEDILEYKRDKAALGKTIREYVEEIKLHLDKYDYESALKVLEVDMVNDRKKLVPFIYKILINYNARRGDAKEAYRLFLNFKKRQGIVSGAMYTCMFNACANCSDSFYAIKTANAVETCMRDNKHHSINTSNYNVMLKAYGRHGDIPTCLKIMDEVMEKRDVVKSDTYNFLLQACISDKNSGFRHFLIVWRKMLQNRVKPDIYSFNLLLKCVHECSLGDTLLIPRLLDEIISESGKFFKKKVTISTIGGEKKRKVVKIPVSGEGLITPIQNEAIPEKNKKDLLELPCIEANQSSLLGLEPKDETSEGHKEVSQIEMENLEPITNEKASCVPAENVASVESASEKPEKHKSAANIADSVSESQYPNLIALEPTTGCVIDFGVMTEPHHRFMLLGGVKGLLKSMEEFGVKPNVKSLTMLLNVIPSTLESEQEVLSLAEAYKIKLDTGFFNMLIRRRFLRDEDSSVKECLELMFSLNIKPDLITFGVLALGCRTYELGMDLLKSLRKHGYRANSQILETLLKRAMRTRDMKYALALLQAAKEDQTDLTDGFMIRLSKLVDREKYLRMKNAENKLLKKEDVS